MSWYQVLWRTPSPAAQIASCPMKLHQWHRCMRRLMAEQANACKTDRCRGILVNKFSLFLFVFHSLSFSFSSSMYSIALRIAVEHNESPTLTSWPTQCIIQKKKVKSDCILHVVHFFKKKEKRIENIKKKYCKPVLGNYIVGTSTSTCVFTRSTCTRTR